MTSLWWAYTVEAQYGDEPPEYQVFRFPSRPWWGCAIMLCLGRLAARSKPVTLKDGTIVTRQPDGSVEYLGKRKPNA